MVSEEFVLKLVWAFIALIISITLIMRLDKKGLSQIAKDFLRLLKKYRTG